MARTKSPAIRREPSEIKIESNGAPKHRTNGTIEHRPNGRRNVSKMLDHTIADVVKHGEQHGKAAQTNEPGYLGFIISVGCIYGAFLTWAVLQERITTTPYGPSSSPQKWNYPLVLNTVQSTAAAIIAYIYLSATTSHPHKPGRPAPIFPSFAVFKPLLLTSITSSLASPFGYASLKHVDYITFILAKSCKLLPTMFLSVLFGRKFPFHKYLVVVLVTLGVSIFTLNAESVAAKAAKHSAKNAENANKIYGITLLAVNLLFDGLTNTVQDSITTRFRPYGGSQMMCAMNILSTCLTSTFLVVSPLLPKWIASTFGINTTELSDAIAFVKAYPQVGYDVLGFALCGGLGQIAIYYTLTHFGSLTLTTVTVTRKMLSMVFSVLWFGHKLTPAQWAGVGLVFGGVGGEAGMKIQKEQDEKVKARQRALSQAGQERAAKERKEL